MDVLGNIIDMPMPILQPRFPLKGTTGTIRTGPAPENGFRTVCCVNSEVPKDRADRNRHAKLYIFRYNQLLPEAFRVIIDGNVKPNCHQWDREVAELKHFAIEMQGKAVSTGQPGGKRKWWVEFVGAMVTISDFYAYLENLVREVQLASFDVPDEIPRERLLRDAKRISINTMLQLKCSAFKSLLEKDVDIHKAYLTASKSLPIFQRDVTAENDAEEMLAWRKGHLDTVQTILGKVQNLPQAGFDIGPRHRYYAEYSGDMLSDFWQSKWDVDVASSMYKWAAGVVEITENAYAPVIGDIMATTFIDSAHATWKYVLAPRYENDIIRVKATKPFSNHKFSFPENPEMVEFEYRNVASKFENKGGIELVRVPLADTSTKKTNKKTAAPAVEPLPKGKRLRRPSP